MAKKIEGFFWTAPLEASPDFSPEDPLALDYLAQQIGQWLFPGFTSRTSRAGYYPMVLYGLSLCEDAAERYGVSRRDRPVQELFEKWEKFWALAVAHYHEGDIPREDVMRGLRGVTREYRKMGSALHLDYKLLARQLELGGLGAYLSSLRHFRLVEPGGLRPTPLGREIAANFWFGEDENRNRTRYHSYALYAIDPELSRVPDMHGNLSLWRLGQTACLSRIRERNAIQRELWRIMFKENRDGTTLPLVKVIIEAHKKNIADARTILKGILSNRWESVIEPDLKTLVHLAFHFSEIMTTLRFLFDDLFKSTIERGYVVDVDEIIQVWLSPQRLDRLRVKANNLIKSPRFTKLASLPMHGAAFVKFVRQLSEAPPIDMIYAFIKLHDVIQKERTRGRGWIQIQEDKLIVELTSYKAWRLSDEDWMNDYKIGPIRSILFDLGKLR